MDSIGCLMKTAAWSVSKILATDQEEYWHTLQMYRIRRKVEAPRPKKVAIYGGTFDPFHIGHRKLLEDIKAELGVDEVIVAPNNVSPHKQGKFSAPKIIRYRIAKAALTGLDGISVTDFDLNRDGPSYTIDLVDHIRSQYMPGSKFYFVIGEDNVKDLDTWKNIDELQKKVSFVAYTRPGFQVTNPRVSVQRIERPAIDINATMIRQRVALGMPIEGFVLPQVEKIIHDNDLYLPEDIFTAANNEPIISLNRQPFKYDKPFVLVADAHGSLLVSFWKEEYAQAFQELTGKTFEEGLQWVEDNIVAQLVADTTHDVPFDEIVTMLARAVSLNNKNKTRDEIISAIKKSQKHYWSASMAKAIPGAIEALRAIKEMGIPIKIVSGTRDSKLVYQQLQNAGYGDLISQEDIYARDRQEELIKPDETKFTPREGTIKHIMDELPGHNLLLMDDWIEGASVAKHLNGTFIALPQGKGSEQKRNYYRLRAEGAAMEITDAKGFKRLVSLIKVLNAKRHDQVHNMVTKNVRMAMAQFNPTVGDLVDNFNRLSAKIEEAKSKQADLIVFPELAMTGYLPVTC